MSKIASKLIATFLVLAMTAVNLVAIGVYLTGEAIAIAKNDELELQGIKTNNENVEFDVYFEEDGKQTHTRVFDVNEEQALIYLELNLEREEGYLKNAKVQIQGANFELNKDIGESKIVQEINENEIIYKQINGGIQAIRPVQIIKGKTELVDKDEIGKKSCFKLTGTYIDKNGNEIEIEKEINIYVGWTDENAIKITENLEKFITYENGMLLQNKIEIERTKGILPIESNTIEVQVAKINGKLPEDVKIISKSTKATNGKEDEHVILDKYIYNKQTGTVTLKVENNEENGKIWAGEGKDIFSIISMYGADVKEYIEQNPNTAQAINVKSNMKIYNDSEIVEKEEIANFKEIIENTKGNLIETQLKVQENEINKGKIYANNLNKENNYETEYNTKYELEVNKIQGPIKIVTNADDFVGEDNFEKQETYYKTTEVEKDNFLQILGENGYIKLFAKDTEIGTINKDNLKIEYNEINIDNITIEISKPITEGYIYIKHKKVIKQDLDYTKEKLQKANGLKTTLGTSETIIPLTESITKASINVNTELLHSGRKNENIEMQIKLHNNEETSDLYINPKLEIELPEIVENVEITSTKVVFDDELQVASTNIEEKDGKKYIVVNLEGIQAKFNANKLAQGTNILLNTNLSLKESNENTVQEIKLNYTNENAVTYAEQGIAIVNIGKTIKEGTQQEEEIVEEKATEQTETSSTTSIMKSAPLLSAGAESNIEYEAVLTTSVGDEPVHEGQIFEYIVTVKNTGTQPIENALVTIPVPEGTIYVEYGERDYNIYNELMENVDEEEDEEIYDPHKEYMYTRADYYENDELEKKEFTIEKINTNETATCKMHVKVKKVASEIRNIENIAKIQIGDNLKETNSIKKELKSADAYITIRKAAKETVFINEGTEIPITIYNLKDANISNAEIQMKLPDGIEFERIIVNDQDGDVATYNRETRLITINISELKEEKNFRLFTSLNKITTAKLKAMLIVNGEKVTSNEIELIGKEKPRDIDISYTSATAKQKVKEGDEIEYVITAKNNSEDMKYIIIKNTLPDILELTDAYFISGDDKPVKINTLDNKSYTLTWRLLEENKIELRVKAVVKENVSNEIEIRNAINITIDGTEEKTLEVVHYLKTDEPDNPQEEDKYEIKGNIWLDKDKNGEKANTESMLENITIKLLNTETNQFITETTTNKNGEYIFKNIEKGNYIVVAYYNSEKYRITEYKKENANQEITSKFIKAFIVEENENRTPVAISDTIDLSKNTAFINLGLIENEIFDLKLDKYINQVIVQNNQGIKTYEYGNSKIAKVEIPAKYITGSTVLIEYKMVITNEGEIAGYANEIVDNLPKDLSLVTEINSDWYLGNDGNLHTEALTKDLIKPGETREILLVLRKRMTEDNAGTINNIAEIYKASNELNLEDKIKNDTSSADVIISIKTGQDIITVITILIISAITIATGIYVIKKKVL